MTGNCRKLIRPLLALAVCLTSLGAANAQAGSSKQQNILGFSDSTVACPDSLGTAPLEEAFRLACLRWHPMEDQSSLRNVILIGFVGGFVRHNDSKHPEVHFASLVRNRYPSSVHAEVFANHDGKKALRRVLELVDSNGDGLITADEKERAQIIIYGHSWGASQTVTLAHAIGQRGVPVLLTIQVDSVRKPGQQDAIIPANVKHAINFYQTKSLIHGSSRIRAADPEQTHIIGNFRMDYRDRHINCDNYPWLALHFNKSHHEIENDPRVWNEIASVIELELSPTKAMFEASVPSDSLP